MDNLARLRTGRWPAYVDPIVELAPVGLRDSPITLVVAHRRALRRLLWAPDEIGLARAWVTGDLDVEGDLSAALAMVLDLSRPDDMVGERPGLRTIASPVSAAARLRVLGPPPRPPREEIHLRGRRHTQRRDAEAIAYHYDVGNEFYRTVLGDSMTYAYWDRPDPDPTDPAQVHRGGRGRDLIRRGRFQRASQNLRVGVAMEQSRQWRSVKR